MSKQEKKWVKTITGVCTCKGDQWAWKIDYVNKTLTLTCSHCGDQAVFRLVDPGHDIKAKVLERAKT